MPRFMPPQGDLRWRCPRGVRGASCRNQMLAARSFNSLNRHSCTGEQALDGFRGVGNPTCSRYRGVSSALAGSLIVLRNTV